MFVYSIYAYVLCICMHVGVPVGAHMCQGAHICILVPVKSYPGEVCWLMSWKDPAVFLPSIYHITRKLFFMWILGLIHMTMACKTISLLCELSSQAHVNIMNNILCCLFTIYVNFHILKEFKILHIHTVFH